MRKLIAFAALLAVSQPYTEAQPHFKDPRAAGVQQKIDVIQSGKAKPGSIFIFTVADLNAWARAKLPTIVPEGVRDPRLELGNGTATGYATVNFLKVRHAQGIETGWFLSKLIDGEKPVKVNVRIQSSRGRATVYLQRVEISGLAVSGSTLDFLIDNFFRPLYPEAKINQPFELQDRLDRIEIQPAEARAVMKR